ncbi:hypothetical protein PIB30_056024, partial [Stylosanthes scabra]|nr:hypothetical protein [Stylosanthes scabra]
MRSLGSLLSFQTLIPTQSDSTSSPRYTAEDLDFWRKLDVRPSSRILRQLSKLEP